MKENNPVEATSVSGMSSSVLFALKESKDSGSSNC